MAFGNDSGSDQRVGLLERPLNPVELVPPDGLRPGQVGSWFGKPDWTTTGATKKWARASAGLDDELPEQSRYVGSHGFTACGFSHSIDGFTVTTAGTITSTPSGSGSSGFSGGCSGGGGGGGGGGSW